MRNRLTPIVLCGLLLAFCWSARAAVWENGNYNTTEGTEFYLAFMQNGGAQASDAANLVLYIYATARQDATLTLENTLTGYRSTFTVAAGSMAYTTVPSGQAYCTEGITPTGLSVTSTSPVSLYITNYKPGSYDATNVLPLNGLGKEYVVQTYMTDDDATEFAVVATKDNTTVHFTIQKTFFDDAQLQVGIASILSVTSETRDIVLQKG